MKYITIFFIFIITSAKICANSIGVGVVSDKICFWRFWEKSDSTYKYKIVVFNTSDTVINFKLQQYVLKNGMELDTNKKNIFIETKIKVAQFRIVEIPHNYGEYLNFIVDGQKVGILGISSSSPPKDISAPFISDEILDGRNFPFWISKNHLFSKNNHRDTLRLYLNYNERPRYSENGFFNLLLRPYLAFELVEIRRKNKIIGNLDVHGLYKLELPYYAEYDSKQNKDIHSNEKIELDIIYKIKSNSNLFLGLESYSKIDLLTKNRVTGKLEKGYSAGINLYLPIMVIKNY